MLNLKSASKIDWEEFKLDNYEVNPMKNIIDNIREAHGQNQEGTTQTDNKQSITKDLPRHLFIRTEGTCVDNFIIKTLTNTFKK